MNKKIAIPLALCIATGAYFGIRYAARPTLSPIYHDVETFGYTATHYSPAGEGKETRNDLGILLVNHELYYTPYHNHQRLGHIQFGLSSGERHALFALADEFGVRPCKGNEVSILSPDEATRRLAVQTSTGEGTSSKWLVGQERNREEQADSRMDAGCGNMKGFEKALLDMFPEFKAHYKFAGPMPQLPK